ncbi:MAG: c-type cytochrome [Saprospiraceae bacterium]
MLFKRIFGVIALLCAFSFGAVQAQPSASEGKELFAANCSACHARDMKSKLTGPALAGTEERWAAFPRTDLYKWIRQSQVMIKEGHPRAVALWNEWKPTIMNNFTGLTDNQIESILLYVNEVASGAGAAAAAVPGGAAGDVAAPQKSNNYWLFVGLAFVLGMLAFALMRIVDNLNNIARVQAGEQPINKSWVDTLSSKGFIAFLVFAMTLLLGYRTVDNATRMQRQQDYMPDQPIWFSHKIHSGQNKIDCQYCHDSARRSKHSSIPGANTCMNCHSVVKVGPKSGTSEITKIYASIGFDPISGKYIEDYENWDEQKIEELYKKWIGQAYMEEKGLTAMDDNGRVTMETQWEGIVKALKNDSNGKIQGPIEWIRIHNLADHAYFNHAQHVAVGKVECQKCHGPIEEMDVVYQYSTLGMGWCINCHRETEVKFADNGFYKDYNPEFIKMHKASVGKPESSLDKIYVEDIGGLECQKCHY